MYIPPKNEVACEDDVVNTNNTSENNTVANQGTVSYNNYTLVRDEDNKNNTIGKEILTVTINVSTNKKTDNVIQNSNQDIVKVGHFKNSLKRRKRSVNKQTPDEDEKAHESKHAPLIVDYETSHKPSHSDLSQFSSTDNVKNSNLRVSQEPSHIEIGLPTHKHSVGNVIKNSDLADFNIETLHEKEVHPIKNNLRSEIEVVDTDKTKQSNLSSEESNKGDRQTFRDSEESVEDGVYNDSNESRESKRQNDYSSNDKQSNRDRLSISDNTSFRGNSDKKYDEFPNNYRDNKKPFVSEYNNSPKSFGEREENDEKIKYPNNPSDSQENFESNEKANFRQDKKIYSDESEENYEPKEKLLPFNNDSTYQKIVTDRPELVESNESNSKSKESDEADSFEASKYSKTNSEESAEKYQHDSKPYRNDQTQTRVFNSEKPYNLPYNTESSNENKDSNEYNKNESNNQTASKIQNVDLGDFSYERIELNDKGQVVPARDSYEEPLTPRSKNGHNESNEKLSSSKEDSSGHSGTESNEDKGLVRINDGEIKPVVEINGDNNSGEFISKEPINSNLKIKDESLEEFLDVKDLYKNDQNEKLKIETKENKEDIKQQVERIPLNYEHDKSKGQDEHQSLTTEKNLNLKTKVEISEGTIESIPTDTDNSKYDENLKFKFDDVTVSLPEIKLPDDILTYAYEEPQYQRQKKQKNKKHENDSKFYRYGSLNRDEKDDKNRRPHDDTDDDAHSNHDDDDDDTYYGRYRERDNYKNKNDDVDAEEDEEDHADLYEKFVRERFGKRGTFTQRSENLKNSRLVADPHLYKRIKNVLKKTHEIEKQAQKSGDPNAGYMWTLEYGQKL
nr:putative uncharacterized protein DDB_G0289963 [Plodia interpunctella]